LCSADGGYFVMLDISHEIENIPKKYFFNKYNKSDGNAKIGSELTKLENIDYSYDFAFIRYLLDKCNILLMPLSLFYDNRHIKDKRFF